MRSILTNYLFAGCTIFCTKSYTQITVTTGQTANQLAQKLVGNGVTISNATLISTATQSGKFTATANAFLLPMVLF